MNYHFAFDLDGTITQREVLPIIAKELGIEEEMAILTRRTMDGEIPFDHSFTMRVNMLKEIPISTVQEIVKKVPLSKPIVSFIKEHPDRCHIVTGNLDVWVQLLVEKIGCHCLTSEAVYTDNSLHGLKNILRKKTIHTIVKEPVVVIGDGNNDFEMMQEGIIGIAYGGVHNPAPSLLEIADYAIYNDQELCRFLNRLS